MILQIVTDAVVSKRYDGAPALHLSEDGNFLSFRIGHKVYDTRIKGPRWINFNVYAAGELAQRIAAMNLREGSHINDSTCKPGNWGNKHLAFYSCVDH